MSKLIQPEYIFETSWEVCNMVGGIYTVLSTRAATLQAKYGDKLIFVGPDVWGENSNPYFVEKTDLLVDWKKYTENEFGLTIRIGRWDIPGQPLTVLVDFTPLMEKKNDIYTEIWSRSGVDSIQAYGDYDESSMFGYATGMIIDSYYRFFKLIATQDIAAHFNEWMTTFGAFYIKMHQPSIATLFTTHATSIGRSIAGNHKPLYDYLEAYNGDQMAKELNMVAKHSTEKIAAHLVDCFTTVSEITGIECKQLLDKTPDIITPNGFENDFVPQGDAFNLARKKARASLTKVAERLIGAKLSEDVQFICTAGRYEYKNKGIDIFIEALRQVSDYQDLAKELVVFIMVPAHIIGPRKDLAEALENPKAKFETSNRFATHQLHNYQKDSIISALQWFYFKNEIHDKVKVIFVPSYLNGSDGIFNMTYYELLIGMNLTVFPSYYEPWGYTPLESTAFKVPTITTDLSGFGRWVSGLPQDISEGVGVIHRSDYNGYSVANQLADMIYRYASFSPQKAEGIHKKAANIAEKALWVHFIKHYEKAYSIALTNKNKRIKIKK